MNNLRKAEINIKNRYYYDALDLLQKEKKESAKKDYLLAFTYYNLSLRQDKSEKQYLNKAYDLLLNNYFKPGPNSKLNNILRKNILKLLERVSKIIDFKTYLAITSRNIVTSKRDIDIIRSIYFGEAKYRSTIAEQVNENKMILSSNLKSGRTINENEYFIQFYKNYSSFTPLLKPSINNSYGGGYFINLDNYGLVIDPGHNFLDIFYSSGRGFDDIDGIVVTHFHDDHYADLPSILTLIYQSRKNINFNKKKFDLFLDRETYNKFKNFFIKSSRYNQIIKLSTKMTKSIRIKPGLFLKPLQTQHKVINKNSGVGVLININSISTQIFLTGDTGWNENIGNNYKEQIIDSWKRILVAHISTLYNEEAYSFIKDRPKFYDQHLCIHGLLKCIKCIKPKVVILSEIGEELSPIIDNISELIKNKLNIKCEIGMNGYRLPL